MANPLETNRRYRHRVRTDGLVGFSIRVEQTDLFIRAEKDLSAAAYDLTAKGRGAILEWTGGHPDFLTALSPLPPDPSAPPPVREMLDAARLACVGPMAAVAGAMAEYVGRGLMPVSPGGVIVENGGDIFLAAPDELVVGLFAGESALSMRLGLSLDPDHLPAGIGTSTGTFGHSLSLGHADAATVAADGSALADAAATALGNRLNSAHDIEAALEWVIAIPGVRGAAAMVEDNVGFLGDLSIVPI